MEVQNKNPHPNRVLKSDVNHPPSIQEQKKCIRFYLRRSRQVYELLTLLYYYIWLLRAYTTSKNLYMESKVVGYENLGFLMRSAVCLLSAVFLPLLNL